MKTKEQTPLWVQLEQPQDQSKWSHDKLQAMCYQWHIGKYPEDRRRVHANMANSVGGRYGSHNTAIGVQKGRADLQFFDNCILYLFEFKVGSDRQKPDQKAFQEENEAHGAKYRIIRTLEQYQSVIKHYVKGELPF